jgi:hypothetical protein
MANERYSVAMFHTGRCGSTVIGEMLNKNQEIAWRREIFEPFRERVTNNHRDFMLETLQRDREKFEGKIYGFETKYLPQQHLNKRTLNISLPEYIKALLSLNFDRFIVLHRKNYLRKAVSAEVGRMNQVWHTTEAASKATSVKIDLESFELGNRKDPLIKLFVQLDESYAEIQELLPAGSLLLTYEDDVLHEPNIGYLRACDYLGIEPRKVTVPFERTNPFRLEEMIENFGEIQNLLCGTKYEWMLSG